MVQAEEKQIEEQTEVLSFEANATTGYAWTGFVFGGNSVELEDEMGEYVVDDTSEMETGVGGTAYFTLKPVEPGQSIVVFEYARGWEEGYAERVIYLADVDEEMNITTMDITETSVIEGNVIELDEENHAITIVSDEQGEVIANFAEELELPLLDEDVCLYTNGTMTMSLPPIVNVLAWGSAQNDIGRVEMAEGAELDQICGV